MAQIPSSGRAVVKSVVSGDTVVLRGRPVNGPPPERVLSFANVSAPRLGSAKEPEREEAFAFESREYLRKLLVGKEVAFKVEYTTTTNKRDFGVLTLAPPGLNGETNLTRILVKEGWLKVKQPEGKRTANEETVLLSGLEEEAQAAKKGIWADPSTTRKVASEVSDLRAFLEKHKKTPIDAIIEQVRDGSTYRVCLLLPWGNQYITLMLSGVKAPIYRKDVPGTEDLVEPYAEEAKYFVEVRLLQREVKVILEGVSNNNFVGSVIHPVGNIAEALLGDGFAKVVDWTLTLVTDGPAKLRAAEERAKGKKLRLWKDYVAKQRESDHDFDAVVTKIITPETILVQSIKSEQERKITLASIRVPKAKDDKEAGYNWEGRELLRSKVIGKKVHVSIDFVKPAEAGFERRECATVRVGDQNLAELLVSRGLAQVVRYRKDDDNRASAYDQLLIAEDAAMKAGQGVHSKKDNPLPKITDASENAQKAKQNFLSLQRGGLIKAVVEYASSASRFVVWIPHDNIKLTFLLTGIRGFRVGRTPSEKSEPFAQEALDYVNKKVLQRDVEIKVDSMDKTSGFVGTMFLPGKHNLAVLLLERGFAELHEYSASKTTFGRELLAADAVAKEGRKGIWSIKDPNESNGAEEVAVEAVESVQEETKEVQITEILGSGQIYVQVMGPDSKRLEKLMSDFADHHKKFSGPQHTPRNGEYVSGQFSADNAWYRARVKKVNQEDKTFQVLYIDYGNSEILPLERIRVLDSQFSTMTLPAQAIEAQIAYLNLPKAEDDFHEDVYLRLQELTEGKVLQARVVGRTKSTGSTGSVINVLLFDKDHSTTESLNEILVREGLGTVAKLYAKHFAQEQKAGVTDSKGKGKSNALASLVAAQEDAKKARSGMWRYGDFTEDD
ncbi:hypothetical protein BJ742DRAFT_752189 [Cladochytrium replicatum]|nr:hypothetical protein BJ742DRAFT_752189 [Cladochytrium replicatum]